jgi:hypothetical protein
MIQQLQTPPNLLGIVIDERRNVGRTQKTMPVDQPDEVAVTFGQLNGGNRTGSFEAGETG